MSTNYIPEVGNTAARDAILFPETGRLFCNSETGQIEFYDGAVWAAVGGGGGMWTSIEKQVIGGAVSQVDFETGLTGKDAFKLVGSNIELDGNAAVRIRVKAAGVYKVGAADYEYAHHVIGAGGPSSEQNANSAFIEMNFSLVLGEADERFGFEILFQDISQVADHVFAFRAWYTSAANIFQVTHGGGTYVTGDDIEGVRIYPSTGNIDSGVMELFGR